MAEGFLAAHPTDEALGAPTPASLDTRKRKLAQMLKVKLEQGYRIESQRDTEVFTQGRRHWFGLFGGGEGTRQIISVDDQGTAKTRTLSPSGTSESRRGETPLVG